MVVFRSLGVAAALAAVFVLPAAAAGCLPGDPACVPAPPSSIQVNPDPALAGGAITDVGAVGSLVPLEFVLPAPAVAVEPLAPASVPSFPTLSLPLRYQDPSDASCGVQALGMALSAIPGSPPTSPALLGFLQGNGMMYDFGTGVEELAFAAQSFGYKGALPFYGGDLSTLASELAESRPVVVSLGAKGEGQPGHFVTVTGISPDGSWIAYNDPTLGEQVLPASEFLRLWGLQGNSGVVVAPALPPAAPDPMPWVALAAGMMALVSTTPLGLRRKGIGGRITAETGTGSSKSAAPKPAPKSAPKPASKPAPKPAAPSRSSSPAKYGKEPPPPPKPTPKPTPPTDYAEEARSARAEDRLARVSVSTPQTRFDAETPTPAPTQKPTETPAPPGRATATPEPVVTLTPEDPRLAGETAYIWSLNEDPNDLACLPLFWDPSAQLNGMVTTELTVRSPLFSLDRGRPGETNIDWADAPGAARLVAALDQITRAALAYANASYMAGLQANIRTGLYYNAYTEGVRVPGLVVENQSGNPLWVDGVVIRTAGSTIGQEAVESDFGGLLPVVVDPGEERILHLTPADVADTSPLLPYINAMILMRAGDQVLTSSSQIFSAPPGDDLP